MPVSHTPLTSGSSGTTASSRTTASVTPTANRLQLLAVEFVYDSVQATKSITVTGCGLTWVEVGQIGVDETTTGSGIFNGQLSLYRAMGAAPTTGQLTITTGSAISCAWALSEFAGTLTSGTNGSGAIVQVQGNKVEDGTTQTTGMNAFASTANATYGAVGASDAGGVPRTFTPGNGFAEIHDTGSTYSAVMTMWRSDNDTAVSATASATTNMSIVGVEIAAAPTVTGTLAFTTDSATVAMTGNETISGTISINSGEATVSMTGTNEGAGNITLTTDDATVVMSGAVVVEGAMANISAGDATVSINMVETMSGTLASTADDATVSMSGLVAPQVTGTLSFSTEDAMVVVNGTNNSVVPLSALLMWLRKGRR